MLDRKEKELVLRRAKDAVISRDFALAARLYKGLLKDDAGNIGLLSALGSLYVKSGDDKKALLYYQQIRTLSPDNFESLNSMGGIYRRLGQYDESIQVLQQALATGLNDSQVNYNLGFTYRSMGAYDEAIECFESVIGDNPNDVLAYNHLGAIYALRKDHHKAVAAYRRGLQADPNHPILQYNLAKSCEALHDDKNAAAAYEAALRAKPGWLEAVRDYSSLLLRHHMTKEAADLVNKSVALYPNDAGIRALLGKIYLKQSDYDNAVRTFEKARKIDGTDVKVLSGLAEAYEKSDKAKEAADVMKSAEEVHPEDVSVQKQYAHVLLSGDQYDAAGAKIKNVYDKDQNDVQALDLFGQYYICKNDENKAELYYKKINNIDPGYAEYRKEAAGRYRQTGNFEKARLYLEQYLKGHADDSSGIIALARIDEATGDMAAALANYHKALKYDQYNVLARKEAQRIGDVINEENRIRQETNAAMAENPDDMEIVMDAPEEDAVREDEAKPEENKPEEDPFDFDSIGDSLIKDEDDMDPFAESDEQEEEEEENDDEPQGLDQLVPAGQPIDQADQNGNPDAEDPLDGKTGPADELGEDLPGNVDDGFGAENIETPEENQQPSSQTVPYQQSAQPVGQLPPSDEAADKTAEPIMPESSDDFPLPPNTGDEAEDVLQSSENDETEKTDKNDTEPKTIYIPQPDTGKSELSDTAHAAMDAAVSRTSADAMKTMADAERALSAAEKAWNAAQQAADAAQSVDDVIAHVNDLAREAVEKAAAEKTEDQNVRQQEPEAAEPEPAKPEPAEPEAAESKQSEYDDMIDKAAELLPQIVKMLENHENLDKFSDTLDLFRRLRGMCEYLPYEAKEKFMCSRTRLLLDYVIAKLSGKPGLLVTAEELRKTAPFADIPAADMTQFEGIPENKLAAAVIGDMREMALDLPDAHLARALDDSAAEALRTL